MSKKRFEDYYVGLDIGTNSVGWAVTYPNYSIAKFNKKSMWGVRKFEEASTAEDTRLARTARRRLDRRKDRLSFIREKFAPSINKVDSDFFERLENSKFHYEDKSLESRNTLFDDANYTDVDYHNEFPTIYHLRKHLMETNKETDPRLVYLAVHHIMKYRGHFLFESDLKSENNIEKLIEDFNKTTFNIFEEEMFDLEALSIDDIADHLRDRQTTSSDKQKWLNKQVSKSVSSDNKKIFTQLTRVLTGLKITDLGNIFTDKELNEKVALEVTSEDFDLEFENISWLSEDEKQVIYNAKAIFDWSILEEILRGQSSISEAKVKSYEEHGEDLKLLKSVLKSESAADYKEMFDDTDQAANYVAYIGQSTKKANSSTATAEDFYKYVKKKISKIDKPEVDVILEKMDTDTFMPKQRVSSNGVIPHQVHYNELELILTNASEYLPFLNEVDESGLSAKEQILQLFKFRIPYYIGPINDYHKDKGGYAWVARKKQGKVYPWNFEDMIDVSQTAEEFITRMTNTCTYLFEEEVLPKHSMLYQKFMVLNEINNIKIDGESIKIEVKQKLYTDLFENRKTAVTKNTIAKWLQQNNYVDKDVKPLITGIDDAVKSKLTTLADMKAIFDDQMPPREVIDEIVRYNTLFSEDSDMFEIKIKEEFGDYLNDDHIKALKVKSYAGWGRLSRKLLEEIPDELQFREPTSIIQAMFMTNNNLMELLSEHFEYSERIEELNVNKVTKADLLSYDLLDELYVSPSVKRAIWQSLRLVDEITSIAEHDPTKIFIEMARGSEDTGRTTSRKDRLLALYKNIKEDRDLINGLTASLENTEDARLRSKKLYLYYTQLGRCMYSGDRITLDQLFNENLYDIDHIYPRSKTKDDSFTNLVLVKKKLNDIKSDTYPLSEKLTITSQTKQHWKFLKDKGLINEQKYGRLIRDKKLDDQELSGFIERQIVETRQSTKAVSSMLQKLYPESQIVFTKARNANELRQHIVNETNDRSFFKVRLMNDFHHAKDAYLNIVAGNVYHTQFTTNPYNFIKNAPNRSYNLGKMYERDIERNGRVAWRKGEDGSLKKVAKTLKQNDILVTWLQTDGKGTLFDQTLMKKGKGQVPIKKGMDIDKYGGYNKASIAHYAIVDHDVKNKRQRWLVSIPIHISNQIQNEDDLVTYLEESHEPNLVNVEIIIDHIHARNQLIEFDGKKVRITGKSGSDYVLRNEIQPIFNGDSTVILKELEKEINIEGYNSEELSDEKLNTLYKSLISLSKTKVYVNRFKNTTEFLVDSISNFENLELTDKKELLNELLKLYKSTRMYADLRMIGGSKNTGKLAIGRNLSNRDDLKLINQSVTGLYESEIDVMKL